MLTLAPEPEVARDAIAIARDAELFRRYREDADPAVREQLVERFLPLARHLASRYRGHAERDDLEQVASLALLKAIDRFDPDRGLAFTSFAVPTVLGELKRYFRDYGWTVRVPRAVKDLKVRLDTDGRALSAELGRAPTPAELAERSGATVEEVMDVLAATTALRPDSLDRPVDESDDSTYGERLGGRVDPEFARAEDATVVNALLETLPERERLILRLRFERDLTQAEIGEQLGISQMHVSRLIRQSIARLHTAAHASS